MSRICSTDAVSVFCLLYRVVGLFLLRAISFQFHIRWNFLTGERDLVHPWPQAEKLLYIAFQHHIYLVSILFYLCFQLLKWKQILWCCAGVLLPVFSVRGIQGGFLMLSPLLMSISPEVLLHFQTSLVQQYQLCLNGHDSEKSSAGVWPCTTLFLSPHHGKAMLSYMHEELLDSGEKGVIECCNSHFQWEF